MSLRGHGSYFINVGNIFSGLYLPIKTDDQRPQPSFVRRVQRRAEPSVALMPATSTQTLASVAAAEAAAIAKQKHNAPLTQKQAFATGVTGAPLTQAEAARAAKSMIGDGKIVRPWARGSEFSRQRKKELGKRMAELKKFNLVR